MTSAATQEGVVSLKDRLRELARDESLLPSLHTQLPSSWVTVEDKLAIRQPHTSVPITDVSYAIEVCEKHGLTEERCRELLNYLHQVGSILYYSQQVNLAQALFPELPFVVTVLKAVFRHDYHLLTYDYRFIGAGIDPQQFEEMKLDLVCNGIARIPMLLALWSKFHLTADRHTDVFIRLFLALDFAYLTGSSDDAVEKLVDTLVQRAITSTVPMPMSTNTISTPHSSSQTIKETYQPEKTDSCKEMICKLKQHNVGLLLPWLLSDEEPDDLKEHWPSDIADGVMQGVVKYTFACDCPLGLFERLSARCHRHSNYFLHWSSGLLMCYGAVTLLFNCSKSTSPRLLSLSGRVAKSHLSAVRLWHVLLRCVSDVENLLQSIPGVLTHRSICSGSSSTTSTKSVLNRPKQLTPNESWGLFAVDTEQGRYSAEMLNHVQAIKQVCTSVKEGIPLAQVLSSNSATLVDERIIHEIAEDVGKYWPKLTSVIGTDQWTVSKLRENISDSTFAQPAAFRILSEWLESRNNQLMVCELYDALLVAHIPSMPQHLCDVMSPDAASGLQKAKDTAAPDEINPPDAERVTPVIMEIVAQHAGHRWREISIYLGVSEEVRRECERQIYALKEKLSIILSAWINEDRHATVERLLKACDEAKVGGIARREIASQLDTSH